MLSRKDLTMTKIAYQILTNTLRWENTGGNCMILAAQATVALWEEQPWGSLQQSDSETFWAMAGCDGVGFYKSHECPLDLDDAESFEYFDWQEVAMTLASVEGHPVPENYRGVYTTMTGLYNYYMQCNDNQMFIL